MKRLVFVTGILFLLLASMAGAQSTDLPEYGTCHPWAQDNAGNFEPFVPMYKFFDCQTAVDIVRKTRENGAQFVTFQELSSEAFCLQMTGGKTPFTQAWKDWCNEGDHWKNSVCCGCPTRFDGDENGDFESLAPENAELFNIESVGWGAWTYDHIPYLVCNPYEWYVPEPYQESSAGDLFNGVWDTNFDGIPDGIMNVIWACAKWPIAKGGQKIDGDFLERIGFPGVEGHRDAGFFPFVTLDENEDQVKPEVIYSVYLPSGSGSGNVRARFIDAFVPQVWGNRNWVAAGDWNFDPYGHCSEADRISLLDLLAIPGVGVCSDPNMGPCDTEILGLPVSTCPLPNTHLLGALDFGVGNNPYFCINPRGITRPLDIREADHALVQHNCGFCGDGVCGQGNMDNADDPETWRNCCTDCDIPENLHPGCARICCNNNPDCKPYRTRTIICCPNIEIGVNELAAQAEEKGDVPPPWCGDVCQCGCPPGSTEYDY